MSLQRKHHRHPSAVDHPNVGPFHDRVCRRPRSINLSWHFCPPPCNANAPGDVRVLEPMIIIFLSHRFGHRRYISFRLVGHRRTSGPQPFCLEQCTIELHQSFLTIDRLRFIMSSKYRTFFSALFLVGFSFIDTMLVRSRTSQLVLLTMFGPATP